MEGGVREREDRWEETREGGLVIFPSLSHGKEGRDGGKKGYVKKG